MRSVTTVDRVRELFDLDPDTGRLTRLVAYHKGHIGREMPGSPDRDGYRLITVDRRVYRLHRLVWLHYYGEWPDGQIDHINGVRDDNRIANLRIASPSQNMWNSKRQKNNKCGVKGVSWNSRDERWQAQIKVNRKSIALGTYSSIEEAAQAYRAAAMQYHGDFARTE